MASRTMTQNCLPGDVLLVVHDFKARSADELSLTRGDKIVLIERDDDFGDGWFLGNHLDQETSGLFPEVYTTPAPKSLTGGRRMGTTQLTQGLGSQRVEQSEAPTDDTLKAPPVQPLASNNSDETDGQSAPGYGSAAGDRAVSNPLPYSSQYETGNGLPSTPPSSSSGRRPPMSAAQRSISMQNGTHQNSPVMNETLSVIEEHITDMSTPRHSLLTPDRSSRLTHIEEPVPDPVRRMSYINGQETDEEESGMLSEQEVRAWNPDRVAEYLADLGVDESHCSVFKEQEISGEVLLGMDQGSLMLKEFELGSIGKRLALWQKIKAIQEEVRISRAVPRISSDHSPSESPFDETQAKNRSRSTSVGLPRIPSLMEGSTARVPSRQHMQRTPSHQRGHQTESLSSLPTITREERGHESRPSAASVRDLQHNRRHSSIDQTQQSLNRLSNHLTPAAPSHQKNGSFDRSWTMGSTTQSPTDLKAATSADSENAGFDLHFASFPHEVPLTVVSSIDLDRGYFSGNEAENRKSRNILRKRDSPSHSRGPSDSTYSPRRLSGVFQKHRAGSTDSLIEQAKSTSPSALQSYYGSGRSPRATSGPQIGKSWRNATPNTPPTVTKLDYTQSPSIDAIAAASPTLPAGDTSSIDHPAASPAIPGRAMFTKSRVTGLRAISDAITGDERRALRSPTSDKGQATHQDSPLQSPSGTGTGTSTPSLTSKSMERDDSSSHQNGTSSSGRHTPISSVSAANKRRGKKTTSAYLRGLERKSPKEQMEGCDYSGWMKKKSSTLMTTWKSRLFVLRGRRLSYYYSEGDTEEKGLIDISFHRVLPANNDRITGIHAAVTRANASPTSPQNSSIATAASTAAQSNPPMMGDDSGMFIFKLVPPRAGLSKAVNFTKPTVHYFAVDNIQQGRLWMAALMKATIDRDDGGQVVTTYKEKTISLAKAKAMRQRPPALMGDEDDVVGVETSTRGLGVELHDDGGSIGDASVGAEKDREGSLTTDGTAGTNSTADSDRDAQHAQHTVEVGS